MRAPHNVEKLTIVLPLIKQQQMSNQGPVTLVKSNLHPIIMQHQNRCTAVVYPVDAPSQDEPALGIPVSSRPAPPTPSGAVGGRRVGDIEEVLMKLAEKEYAVGSKGFLGKLRNVGCLMQAACVGLVECLTCCCCCCGCGGNTRAHSGMVKYDDEDYDTLSNAEKQLVNIHEHFAASTLCTPVSCMSLMCCLGGCGMCGPVGTTMLIKAAYKVG
jgi:hypothetical protein